MSKKRKKIMLLAIVGCLLLGNTSIIAAENSFWELPQNRIEIISEENKSMKTAASPALASCEAWVGIADNGLYISFDTSATQNADEIGVKNVILQEKNWYGGWNDIAMNNYYTNNSDWHSVDIVYTAAKKGTTYRVKCTHYAKFGNVERTMNNTSSELTYN